MCLNVSARDMRGGIGTIDEAMSSKIEGSRPNSEKPP
jgi:hypothetical protein